MRVLLPSHGVLGQRAVNLRKLTIGDMVALSKYNKNDILRRIETIRLISDVRLDKVTWCDLCYLYDLCCFTLADGKLKYKVKCGKCGKLIDVCANISDLEIAEYKDYKKKVVGDVVYNIISASDMLDAVDTSLYADDEEESLLKSKVALTLGHRFDDFKFVDSLTISEFATALAFEQYYYHGFVKVGDAKCECGETLKYKYDTITDLVALDPNKVYESYVGLASVMSLDELRSLSLAELNYIIEQFNKKYAE